MSHRLTGDERLLFTLEINNLPGKINSSKIR